MLEGKFRKYSLKHFSPGEWYVAQVISLEHLVRISTQLVQSDEAQNTERNR